MRFPQPLHSKPSPESPSYSTDLSFLFVVCLFILTFFSSLQNPSFFQLFPSGKHTRQLSKCWDPVLFPNLFSLKTSKTKTKTMPISLTHTHTPKNESQNQQARRKPLGFIFDLFLIRQNAGLGPDFLLQFKKHISKDIIWSV